MTCSFCENKEPLISTDPVPDHDTTATVDILFQAPLTYLRLKTETGDGQTLEASVPISCCPICGEYVGV